MAWPPIVPPNTRLNTTPTVDNHPSDHNMIADAVTDIANLLGTDPAGNYTDIQDRLDALEQELRPPGELMHFGGIGPPDGRWLATIGGEYPRGAPYDRLFTAVGTLWGAGNGTNTFNVPNLAGHTLVAAGATTVTMVVGSKYGARDVKIGEHTHNMKKHTHAHTHPLAPGTAVTSVGHGHNIGDGAVLAFAQGGGPGAFALGSGWGVTGAWEDDGAKGGAHTHTLTGNSGAASNGPPNDDVSDKAGITVTDQNFQPSANCTIWIRY